MFDLIHIVFFYCHDYKKLCKIRMRSNEIYVKLAWKALQEIMRMHSVEGVSTGSPREILQLGYKVGL